MSNTSVYILLTTLLCDCLKRVRSLSAASAEDFRRTACTSLLQHVVEASSYRRVAKEEELHLSEG